MEKKKCLILLCSEPSGKCVSPMVEMRKEKRGHVRHLGCNSNVSCGHPPSGPSQTRRGGHHQPPIGPSVPSSCSSQIHSHRTYSRISYSHRFTLEMSFKIYFVEIRNLNEIVKEINKVLLSYWDVRLFFFFF